MADDVKQKTFSIREDDDESESYFVNGEKVGYSNHDEDGWAGMERCRKLFRATATALGAVEVPAPEEDDEGNSGEDGA